MSGSDLQEYKPHVEAENIGGIDSTTVDLVTGVNVLTGRNATNRTSFLRALMAALGSDEVSLKGDADHGSVTLTMGEETFQRTLSRSNGTVTSSGDPYLDDPVLVDLFAFLLGSNEARQAVERGDDLRDVLMEPVDTAEIELEINRLQTEKAEIEDELDELDRLAKRLPQIEEDRTAKRKEIEARRDELEEKRDELDDLDADLEDSRQERSELDDALDELSETRNDLERVKRRISGEQESIDAVEEELDELEDELSSVPEVPEDELTEIESEVERLRSRQQSIDSTINELQTVLQFNENVLEGQDSEAFRVLRENRGSDDESSVTDRLVEEGEPLVCWTCGTEIESGQIEDTIGLLKEYRSEKVAERSDIKERIEELQDERKRHEQTRSERERLERRLTELETELEDRRERVDDLQDRRDELATEVERLEEAVSQMETEENNEFLELHDEVNRLEFEVEQLEDDLAEIEDQIETIEGRLADRDALELDRDEIRDKITELRTRIERLEREAVEAFNEQMEAILEMLEYENLDRVWIERIEEEVREGRNMVTKGRFDLHIVRSTADGTVYEDSVNHLSESEREVVGLTFALAGYLAHEVHELCPYLLLDSLEALDSDRIAALVDYFAEFADYFVVALLPEDAAALDDDFHRVTEI